jgi:multimeric flavodoxin WrbA
MKVMAINSSPNMDEGNTAAILSPFTEGMEEAGAEVETLYTKKLKIKPCQGEFNCWLKTPGKCFQKDDMEGILPALDEANIWVLATPLYVDGMSGPMKNFIDRIIPLAEPFIELRDDHCRHPQRGEHGEGKKVVLVSTCGFWERDNFDALVGHVEAICRNLNGQFAGALLRPHGGALRRMLEMGAGIEDVIEAARDAGRQLIREGRMAEETLETISRELLSREDYLSIANEHFRQTLEAAKAA